MSSITAVFPFRRSDSISSSSSVESVVSVRGAPVYVPPEERSQSTHNVSNDNDEIVTSPSSASTGTLTYGGSRFSDAEDKTIVEVFGTYHTRKMRMFKMSSLLNIDNEALRSYDSYARRYRALCRQNEGIVGNKRKSDNESVSSKKQRPCTGIKVPSLTNLSMEELQYFKARINNNIDEKIEQLQSKILPTCGICTDDCEMAIVTTCGHVFCHECFIKEAMCIRDYCKRCPTCRERWESYDDFTFMPYKSSLRDCKAKGLKC